MAGNGYYWTHHCCRNVSRGPAVALTGVSLASARVREAARRESHRQARLTLRGVGVPGRYTISPDVFLSPGRSPAVAGVPGLAVVGWYGGRGHARDPRRGATFRVPSSDRTTDH
jgi:hypothetical protein